MMIGNAEFEELVHLASRAPPRKGASAERIAWCEDNGIRMPRTRSMDQRKANPSTTIDIGAVMTSSKKYDPHTDTSNMASVVEALTGVLADTYRLVLKSHIYHWNVTGPLFFSIHEMTEAHYTDMFNAADVLAERITALGKPALVNPASLSAGPDGQDPDASLSADEMVRDLQADHENVARRMRALIEIAETAGDMVTADLATERAAFHDKAAWMFRATAA